jgi:hypothetical protein
VEGALIKRRSKLSDHQAESVKRTTARRAGCNPTLDGHFVPFPIPPPSLDKPTACSSNVLDMTFRNFSQTDSDYEVFQDQPRDLSVGKVYKVKRRSDGKVRHHYRPTSSSGKDSLFSRRNNRLAF